jgi:hypothetical protein
VFSVTTAVLAIDYTFDGRTRFNYYWDNSANTNEDKIDLLVYAHAKINDDTTLTTGIRDYTGSSSTVDGIPDSTSTNKLYLYEGYVTFKKPVGTITVGSYDFWTSGDVTVLDYIVNDLQHVKTSSQFLKNLNFAI